MPSGLNMEMDLLTHWVCLKRAKGSFLRLMFASAILVGAAALMVPSVQAQNAPSEGFSELVKKVGPAVVNISTSKQVGGPEDVENAPDIPQFPPGSPFEEFFNEFFDRDQQNDQPRQRRASSLGSGFVIDPDGYVVTNNHVIAEADQITITFLDDTEYEAELIGRDPKTDLALLRILGDGPFPAVEWADSDDVEIGDWMVAIGNPFGFGFSVTAGIVSGRGRNISAGPYDDFFQVDAAINRGNSGGPSFTLDGGVFGVNTAIFSPSGGNVGIGFAIPANQARKVIDSIREYGRVARGWLGVRVQSLTAEIAESLGLESSEGALVASVTPGGPAAAAGIAEGDVILTFDGRSITEMRSLPRIVADTAIATEVPVELWRRNEQVTVQVTLGELQDEPLAQVSTQEVDQSAPRSVVELSDLGIIVTMLDEELRSQFELAPEADGVVILEIMEGGPAEEQPLEAGDLILEVNQTEVGSPPELQAQINEAKDDEQKSVLLLINRQGDRRFVGVRFKD